MEEKKLRLITEEIRYKTEFYFLPKQSQKSRSRSLALFRKGKTCIIAKFHGTDLVICSHSREKKTLSCNQINMVDRLYHPSSLSDYFSDRARSVGTRFYMEHPWGGRMMDEWMILSFASPSTVFSHSDVNERLCALHSPLWWKRKSLQQPV